MLQKEDQKALKQTVNPDEIRLKAEYEEFLNLIGTSTPVRAGWEMVARALGIAPQTIESWKRLPEARVAKLGGITRVLNNLDTLSMDDYRADKELLRIYGMDEKEEPEVEIRILKFDSPTPTEKTKSPKLIEGEVIKKDTPNAK
jgi:hypothetical protein